MLCFAFGHDASGPAQAVYEPGVLVPKLARVSMRVMMTEQ